MRNKNIRNLTLSGLFVALGLLLPALIGGIPDIGRRLLPMHLPVLVAGFVVGPWWGALVGGLLPVLNFFITTTPPISSAIPMSFELAAYGLLAGLLYRMLASKRCRIPMALVGSMVGGRIVWGIVSFIYMRLQGTAFTWHLFAAGAFLNAIPGIIVQIVLVPAIVFALEKANLIGTKGHEI